jgi:hypothetical protein
VIRREIVDRRYYTHPSCPRNAGGSVVAVLECGHENRYKYSERPKGTWAYCKTCLQIANGTLIEGIVSTDIDDEEDA